VLIPIAGSGMVTLIPRLAEVHARSVSSVSLAITIYMIPFAVAQLLAGGVAQRFTVRRTVAAGFATFIAGSLGCAAAPGFAVFLACRLVQGIGAAFLFPVLMALVGDVIPPDRVGRAFGAFQSALVGGMAVGPLLAGVLEVWLGWRSFFVLLALHALVAAATFFSVFRQEAPPPRAAGAIAVTLRAMRQPALVVLSLAGAGLFFAVVGTNTYLAASLKGTRGLAEDTIGLVLALHGAVGIPVCPLAGRWGEAVGLRRVAILGLIGYGVVVTALGVLPYSFGVVVILAALLGGAAAMAWTSVGALVVELLPDLRQPASSVYNAFRFLGYALAPPLLGLLYVDGDVFAVFMASALVALGAAAGLAAVRLPARRPALTGGPRR
jgi:predicted MFS family arabinose efflux permease